MPMLRLSLILCALMAPAVVLAQSHSHSGGGHDRMRMPGLQGEDTTRQEVGEMMVMFHHFDLIDRTVEDLPNGIRTVTSSQNPRMHAVLVSHITGMIARIEEGRDPQVAIQSPTLDILFERAEAIETEIEVTDTSVIVVQTSEDPAVVTALQLHAAEVTGMAERGMDAVHERMEAMGQTH